MSIDDSSDDPLLHDVEAFLRGEGKNEYRRRLGQMFKDPFHYDHVFYSATAHLGYPIKFEEGSVENAPGPEHEDVMVVFTKSDEDAQAIQDLHQKYETTAVAVMSHGMYLRVPESFLAWCKGEINTLNFRIDPKLIFDPVLAQRCFMTAYDRKREEGEVCDDESNEYYAKLANAGVQPIGYPELLSLAEEEIKLLTTPAH